MTCAEIEPLLGASLDGELDVQTAVQVDSHVSGCGVCSAQMSRLERLREEIAAADLDRSSETDLRRLAAAIRRAKGEPFWRRSWVWRSAMTTAAVAVLAVVLVVRSPGDRRNDERQIVDDHVRSLLAGHLVDVPSSDHHTVKPWFQGKLSFSPPVPDVSAQGFSLAGGRLDVVHGKPAAALVYKRRQHVINLWICPAAEPDERVSSATLDGFHVLRWQNNGMAYWAVSDLNEPELREFAGLVGAR